MRLQIVKIARRTLLERWQKCERSVVTDIAVMFIVFAAATTGVHGFVYDSAPPHYPIPTAQVTAVDKVTLKQRRERDYSSVDATGYYRIELLPGSYRLFFDDVTHVGQTRDVTVEVGTLRKVETVYLVSTQQVAETITVNATAPVVDVSRLGQPVQIEPETSRAIGLAPTLAEFTRWFTGIGLVGSLPIVAPLGNQDLGFTPPSGIDAFAAGASGATFEPLVVAAEHARSTALTVALEEPSELTVLAAVQQQPNWSRAEQADVSPPAGHIISIAARQFSASAATPLVGDQLWIFSHYENMHEKSTNANSLSTEVGRRDAVQRRGELTLTWAPMSPTLVRGTLGYAPRTEIGIIGGYGGHFHGTGSALTAARRTDSSQATLGADQVVSHTAWVGGIVGIRRARSQFRPPLDTAERPQVRDIANGHFTKDGVGYTLGEELQRVVDLHVNGVLTVAQHELAVGATSNFETATRSDRLTGGLLVDQYPGDVQVERVFVGPDRNVVAERHEELDVRRLQVFARDQWRAADRMMVNAGVRAEQQVLSAAETVATIAILPRVAVVFDFRGDSRSKFTAAYAAFHDELKPREGMALLSSYGFAVRDAAGSVLKTVGGTVRVDEDLEPRVTAEWLVSFDQAFRERDLLTLKVRRRELLHDVRAFVCTEAGEVCVGNPGTGLMHSLQSISGDRQIASPKASQRSDSFNVAYQGVWGSATSATLQYTYTRSRGNVWSPRYPENASVVDPFVDVGWHYADFVLNRQHNVHDLLPTDRRHNVRLHGSYRRRRLTLGYAAFWMSGTPVSRYGYSDRYGRYLMLLDRVGSEGKSPGVYDGNLVVEYDTIIAGLRLRPELAIYNILNAQRPLTVDERWSFEERGNISSDATNSAFRQVLERTPPRRVYFGIRVEY